MFGKSTRVTKDMVLAALKTVQEPELHRDLVTLKMVKDIEVNDGDVSFTITLTTPACPLRNQIESEARAAVAEVARRQAGQRQVRRPGARPINRIAGKLQRADQEHHRGGQRQGRRGQDHRLGQPGRGAGADGREGGHPRRRHLRPQRADHDGRGRDAAGGRRADDPGDRLRRRGDVHRLPRPGRRGAGVARADAAQRDPPALHRRGVERSGLHDRRPAAGTGDAQLSLAQLVPLTGGIIVTTPQAVSLADARRGITAFQRLDVPVMGIVENMAGDVFGEGGGEQAAEALGVPFLGRVCLESTIREGGDAGEPVVVADPDSESAAAFRAVAQKIAAQVSVMNARRPAAPKAPIKLEMGSELKLVAAKCRLSQPVTDNRFGP